MLKRQRDCAPRLGQAYATVGKIKPKTGRHERGGGRASILQRWPKGTSTHSVIQAFGNVIIETRRHMNKENKEGWEAAKVATLLLCQLCLALQKTGACPFDYSEQHPTSLQVKQPYQGQMVPHLGRGISKKLEFRNMQNLNNLWYALVKGVESLIKYTAGLSVCHSWIFHVHMCPHMLECRMLSVLSKTHPSFVHLTQTMRCRSMDVTVKNKTKQRKSEHFSMLINPKERMMCALFSNGGVMSKPWIIWPSKVLLIWGWVSKVALK